MISERDLMSAMTSRSTSVADEALSARFTSVAAVSAACAGAAVWLQEFPIIPKTKPPAMAALAAPAQVA